MSEFDIGGKEYTADEVIIQAQKAAGWLGAITVFSIINLVLMLFNANISFVIGLGITQIITAVTAEAGNVKDIEPIVAKIIFIIGLIINIAIIGMYALLWWLSRRGSIIAYIIGIVLYMFDALLFLVVQDWIGVGFHVFFLFMLVSGFQFMKKRKEVDKILRAQPDEIIDIEPLPQENEANILEQRVDQESGAKVQEPESRSFE